MKKVTMSENFEDIFKINAEDYLQSDGRYHDIPIRFGIATMSEEEFRSAKVAARHFAPALFGRIDEFI